MVRARAFLSAPGWQWLLPIAGWAWLMFVVIVVALGFVARLASVVGLGLLSITCEIFGSTGCPQPAPYRSFPVWSPVLAVLAWGLLVALFATPHHGWIVCARFALLAAVVAASWASGDLLFLARYA